MLKMGAKKRVRDAVQQHVEPGEELQTSALAYVVGKGDFAVGLTDKRLLLVRVTKLMGKPTGEFFADSLYEVSVDSEFANPALVQHFSVKIVTVTRSNEESWKLRFDTMWWPEAGTIMHGLATRSRKT